TNRLGALKDTAGNLGSSTLGWLKEKLGMQASPTPDNGPGGATTGTPTRMTRTAAALTSAAALVGPPADVLFEPVPARDFVAALLATVAQWQAEPDWRDDACNIVLALARIWYSAATGKIAPKDVAAAWVLA
ncbi:DUF4111 domain-containing protein, partial [Bacillus halotolerans]|nr:DUF4111 domain-containing protein [Bacillus halotolerans]